MKKHRILGIDYGSKFIGLAVAMPGVVASPIDAIKTSTSLVSIPEVIQAEDINLIVVGLPRSSEGLETNQSQATREWVLELQTVTDVEVILTDEFGTTALARDQLEQLGVDLESAKQSGEIDSRSAAIILNSYLEDSK